MARNFHPLEQRARSDPAPPRSTPDLIRAHRQLRLTNACEFTHPPPAKVSREENGVPEFPACTPRASDNRRKTMNSSMTDGPAQDDVDALGLRLRILRRFSLERPSSRSAGRPCVRTVWSRSPVAAAFGRYGNAGGCRARVAERCHPRPTTISHGAAGGGRPSSCVADLTRSGSQLARRWAGSRRTKRRVVRTAPRKARRRDELWGRTAECWRLAPPEVLMTRPFVETISLAQGRRSTPSRASSRALRICTSMPSSRRSGSSSRFARSRRSSHLPTSRNRDDARTSTIQEEGESAREEAVHGPQCRVIAFAGQGCRARRRPAVRHSLPVSTR